MPFSLTSEAHLINPFQQRASGLLLWHQNHPLRKGGHAPLCETFPRVPATRKQHVT